MKPYHLVIYCFWLVPVLFQAGCYSTSMNSLMKFCFASVVQVQEPRLSKETISTKLRSRTKTMTSDGSAKAIEDVGVIIELRSYARKWRGLFYGGWREKTEVYTTVVSEVMKALEEAGISASLIRDEMDPRLQDVGPVLYVQYYEDVRIGKRPGGGIAHPWEPGATPVTIPGPAPGAQYIKGPYEIIDRSYVFSSYTIEGDEILISDAVSPVGMVEAFLKSMNIQPSPVLKLPDELKRALASEPRTAKDFEMQGHAYLEIWEYDKAIEALKSAIKLAPKDKGIQGACHNNIGLAYVCLQQYDRALREYEKAMSYDPGANASVALKINMVKPLYHLKEYKRAAELVEYLSLRRQDLDNLLGREAIEEILSKGKSMTEPNNK